MKKRGAIELDELAVPRVGPKPTQSSRIRFSTLEGLSDRALCAIAVAEALELGHCAAHRWGDIAAATARPIAP